MKYAFASVIALSYLLVLVWIGVYLIDGEWPHHHHGDSVHHLWRAMPVRHRVAPPTRNPVAAVEVLTGESREMR